MNNTKVAILLIIVFSLAIAGFYYLYQIQIKRSQEVSGLETVKENFPPASPSQVDTKPQDQNETRLPGQVAGTNIAPAPSSQPETGAGYSLNLGKIEIQSPHNLAQINSPLTVSGIANVPNGLVVEVRDEGGEILGVRKTKACFATEPCPFEISLVFSNPQAGIGTITAYSPSLTDNSPEYSQTINITFKQ